MSKINVNEIIGKSKFNAFFLSMILLGAVMLLFDGYDQGAWGSALTVLQQDTGIGADTFGFISSAGMYGMMIGGIFFGMLADRIGRKRTLIIAVAVYSLFTGLIGFAHTAPAFTVFKLASGIGFAGVGPVVLALVAEYSPIKSRAKMTTITIASIPFGSALSSLISMGLLNSVGWRPLFYLALIPVLLLPLWLFKMPDSMDFYIHRGENDKIRKTLARIDSSFVPHDDDEYVTDTKKQEKVSLAESFKGLFANGMARTTILLWIGFLLAMFTSYSMQIWLAKLMVYGGYGLNSSLFFLLLFNLCALPAAWLAGALADKFGFKKTIMVGVIIVAILIFLLAFVKNEALLIVLLVLDGAGTTAVYNMVYSYITLSYPTKSRGTGIGWACAVGRFGGAWGPAIVGILIAASAPIAEIFAIIAIPYALICPVFAFIKEPKKDEVSEEPAADTAK